MFNKPPLSPELLESVFARLVVTWGRDFTSMYEGVDPDAVKADWADKLRGYQLDPPDDPGEEPRAPAIEWALDNLPEKPLNALGFRKLCGQFTTPDAPLALPAPPRAVPARFKAAVAHLLKPLDDKRPERVRIAARYIAIHGNKAKTTAEEKRHLADAREVMRSWESEEIARAIAKREAEQTDA